jgi:hypothetical protein
MTALSFVHLIMGLQALNSAALAGLVWWDHIAEQRARAAPNPRRRLRGFGTRLNRKDGWCRPMRQPAMQTAIRHRS